MEEHSAYNFPPPDLMDLMVTAYFNEFNMYTPLLHRPSFERNIRQKLHLRDSGFAAVLLMTCALGARACDDPRVLLASEREETRRRAKARGGTGTEEEDKTFHSAGWEWFIQVQRTKLAMSFVPPRTYDLQIAYVSTGTSPRMTGMR